MLSSVFWVISVICSFATKLKLGEHPPSVAIPLILPGNIEVIRR